MLKRNDFQRSLSVNLFCTFGALILSLSLRPNSTSSIVINSRSSECCNVSESSGSVEDLKGFGSSISQNRTLNITETKIGNDEALYINTNITSASNQSSSEVLSTSFETSTIVTLNDTFPYDVLSPSTTFYLSTFSTNLTGCENVTEENSTESQTFNTSYVLATRSHIPNNEVLDPGSKPAKIPDNSYIEDRKSASSGLANDNQTKELSVQHMLKQISRKSSLSFVTLSSTQASYSSNFTWLEIVLLNVKSEQIKDDTYSYFNVDNKSDKEKIDYQLEVPLQNKTISIITNRITNNDNYGSQNTSISNETYNGIIEQPSEPEENTTTINNQRDVNIQSENQKSNDTSVTSKIQNKIKNFTRIQDYVNIIFNAVHKHVSIHESADFLNREKTSREFNNHTGAMDSPLASLSVRNHSSSSNASMIDATEQVVPNNLDDTVKSSFYHLAITNQTDYIPVNHTLSEPPEGSVILEIITTRNRTYAVAGSSSNPISVSNELPNMTSFINVSSDIHLYEHVPVSPPIEGSTVTTSRIDSSETSM